MKSQKNILLTGGRAPATLELARLLHAAGQRVVMAESLPWHVCRLSRAVDRSYRVPSPRYQPTAYCNTLLEIIQHEHIDWLIPTCEEIFYIAQNRDHLTPHCNVFAADLDTLNTLHNKWCFVQRCVQYGLPVPATQLLTTPAQAMALVASGQDLVFKPVYSRGGVQTVILPRQPQQVASLPITSDHPWIAQTFIPGRQICTYSLAQQGRLTAHCAYATEFNLGAGGTVLFEALDHPPALAWVKQFVTMSGFTGQIAFDFIEPNGDPTAVIALECNPRLTSGIHLFCQTPALVQAFFEETGPTLYPQPQPSTMVTAGMLGVALGKRPGLAHLKRWWQTFRTSQDVIFRPDDPWPWLGQWLSLLNMLWWQRKYRLSFLEAITVDIEWNGER
jgi:predicted ATP-grasp superfamily ATP-dependent carboligase